MSAGSWLFFLFVAQTTPDDWLKYHRLLRNLGTYAVIIGVIVETLIGELWEIETPPLLRGRKATTLLKRKTACLKKGLMLFVGVVMVGGGISVEIWQGGKADDVVDQIRWNQQTRIASLNIRNMALTLMATGREAQLLVTPEFFALKSPAFAHIKVYMQTPQVGTRPPEFDQESWECIRGITTKLMKAGWVKTIAPPCPGECNELPGSDIEVWSPSLPSFDCSGYVFPKSRPEANVNACKGADAFVAYLKSVGIRAGHSPSSLVPLGSIVIVVGKRLKTIDSDSLVNLEHALAGE